MSLYITSLNSGSNGNCYYVGNTNEAVLVDAGISCREIEKRMRRLGLKIENVKAIFVSHEHTDHVSGIATLTKKYQLPVYITSSTLKGCRFRIEKNLLQSFQANEPVRIGQLTIVAFPKFHDACDPYSFTITCNDTTVGVFTDIGTPCQNLVHHFKQCHAAFLEANYDEEMLDKGGYPYFLKQRIRGGHGHLSNKQALDLLNNHKAPFMSHVVLSHLSKNNNCPLLVEKLFNEHANGTKVVVASRYEETPVFQVNTTGVATTVARYNMPAPQLALDFA